MSAAAGAAAADGAGAGGLAAAGLAFLLLCFLLPADGRFLFAAAIWRSTLAAISGGTVASLSRARRPKAADCPAPAGRPPARVGGPCAWALERMLLLLLGGGYSCS